jgi:carbonic anhydrase
MNKIFSEIKPNLSSGLVVFLVALPLCLGIALASGAPLFSGMIAGIIGGIIVGSLSGSPLSVSGPAAGLAAVVLSSIHKLGSYETFVLTVFLAGLIQLALGFLKAGIVANFFPSNVIKGMLTAIGIIIIMKQIPHFFGYDKDAEGDLDFLQPDGDNTFTALLEPFSHIDIGATIIGIVSILIILLWDKYKSKKIAFIPGAAIAVIIAALINEFWISTNSNFALASNHLVQLPILHSFDEIKNTISFPDFSKIMMKDVWIIAFTIAIVASIETLLSLEAVDKMDEHKRHSPVNLELKAQGIGNVLSGLIGGLPITSVIVRSSANVNSGATNKSSAIIHGIFLLVCALLIPTLLNKIPITTLASVLLLTGYKLTNFNVYKQMWKKGKYQFVPFIVTVVAVVFTDLLTGVSIGMAMSVFAILSGNIKLPYQYKKEFTDEGHIIRIDLSQEITFLNKAAVKDFLDRIPSESKVIINAESTKYIDHDVLEIIRDFKEVIAVEKNIKVSTTGFRDEYKIENSFPMHVEDYNSHSDKKIIKDLMEKHQLSIQ